MARISSTCGELRIDEKVVKAAKEEVKWIPQGFDWVDPFKRSTSTANGSKEWLQKSIGSSIRNGLRCRRNRSRNSRRFRVVQIVSLNV